MLKKRKAKQPTIKKLRRIGRRNGPRALDRYLHQHGLSRMEELLQEAYARRRRRAPLQRASIRSRGFFGDAYRLLKQKVQEHRNAVQE